jgi:lycopene cyclase domain-containing protein
MATYLVLNVIVLLAVTIVARWRRFRFGRRWTLPVIGLLILTLVFDNVIILAGIVTYDPAKILGVYLGKAPVEDFAYAIVASILVPVLWRRGADDD